MKKNEKNQKKFLTKFSVSGIMLKKIKALTKSAQKYALKRDGGWCKTIGTVFVFVASEPGGRKPKGK